jgi:uncharacterized RDD family membrane protein YckC
MAGEPSVLRRDPEEGDDSVEQESGSTDATSTDANSTDANSEEAAPASTTPRPSRSRAKVVHVAGFWQRVGGALIDVAIIMPISIILGWLVGAIAGLSLPSSRHHGLDFWLDVVLAHDPAIITTITVILTVASVYLFVFQGLLGQTLGMRVTKTQVIDVYGESPSMPIAALRTFGYLACLASLGLGYLWVAIDAEKRGLHDWISRTYVVRI